MSTQDELLWIPDVVAWCHGAEGDWARRVHSLVAKETAMDNWSRKREARRPTVRTGTVLTSSAYGALARSTRPSSAAMTSRFTRW
ncbi:hypothetical protein FXN61_03155 [Lentzea sp. PSKA42]|uniref:Uncharacterized protein n=1 Tax=Lentzea indica TaxID=2604800 RepID=A0ABX1FAC2_9PSEU|nr:hypothetical protein [Lentzea indica]NKE55874.1 hypothetical protein [Lentzea indica]